MSARASPRSYARDNTDTAGTIGRRARSRRRPTGRAMPAPRIAALVREG